LKKITKKLLDIWSRCCARRSLKSKTFFAAFFQKSSAFLLAFSLLPSLAFADGKSVFLHGNDNGALPCAACHGVDGGGNGSTGAPKLAGLPAGVIEAALARFAKGDGGNAMMQSIARSLSPAETVAVAGYVSSLTK
jgi:cytochrome c553